MKKLLAFMLAAALALSLVACGGGSETGDTNTPSTGNGDATSTDTPSTGNGDATSTDTPSGGGEDITSTDTPSGGENNADETNVPGGNEQSGSNTEESAVPNNGEWDEILCSGDGYHLVKKEVDAYDGYKITLGVVDDNGEWVQEMTDTGTFVDNVRFRAEGSGDTMKDSSCYMYLGEGVFLASPGVSVFTKDGEYRVGPWENLFDTGFQVWECLFWNVIDNSQKSISANRISIFQDGYLLFCQDDESRGNRNLNAMNTKFEVTELPCTGAIPIYAEGVFYAYSEKRHEPGFYDIEGNLVITLPDDIIGGDGENSPYFENGQAVVLLKNNAGSLFKGIIDKTGAFVSEPEKVEVSTY